MTKYLLAFDTDRIKSYIFATSKLKEIRAASAILDELNRQVMVEKVGGQCIYANGGGGLFVVDKNEADKIKLAVEKAYREKFASITGTVLEDYDEQKFQEQFRLLGYRLRLAKDQAKGEQLLLTHPFLHFCESCGTEYAQENSTGNELICARCACKREQDERMKGDFTVPGSLHHYSWRVNKDETFEPHHGLWPYLLTQLKDKGYPIVDFNRPEDFNELASLSSPKGYMALIYADGDGMGKQLDKIESESQMRDFAKIVDESMYQATVEAIRQHLQPQGDDKIWPFDVLMLGGDDLIMVTRAESAVAVGKTVMEKFAELTKPYSETYKCDPLQISVSVVIAHAHYPFGALQKLAESGLKFAKKEGAKRRQARQTWQGGLLNFLVVSSANHLDFGEYYKETLTDFVTPVDNDKNLYRTLRPYNTVDLTQLIDTILGLKKGRVPSSKLEQLRSALFQNKTHAMTDCLALLFHWRNVNQRKMMWDTVVKFAPDGDKSVEFPWYKHQAKFLTPLLDLVELYDFVGKYKEENI